MKTQALITCPKCDKKQEARMPMNACQYFYKCISCGNIVKPNKGDCCVFCSYADTRCPSMQNKNL